MSTSLKSTNAVNRLLNSGYVYLIQFTRLSAFSSVKCITKKSLSAFMACTAVVY